jgi:hypothetical protein
MGGSTHTNLAPNFFFRCAYRSGRSWAAHHMIGGRSGGSQLTYILVCWKLLGIYLPRIFRDATVLADFVFPSLLST